MVVVGATVLGGDECEEEGLDVIPLPDEIRQELKSKDDPIWDWIGNPMDVSISGGSEFTYMDMLRIMAGNPNFDLLIANMMEGVWVTLGRKEEITNILEEAVGSCVKLKEESLKPLLVVLGEGGPSIEDSGHWSWQLFAELRTQLIKARIPVYPAMRRAAGAAYKLIEYYHNQSS